MVLGNLSFCSGFAYAQHGLSLCALGMLQCMAYLFFQAHHGYNICFGIMTDGLFFWPFRLFQLQLTFAHWTSMLSSAQHANKFALRACLQYRLSMTSELTESIAKLTFFVNH